MTTHRKQGSRPGRDLRGRRTDDPLGLKPERDEDEGPRRSPTGKRLNKPHRPRNGR